MSRNADPKLQGETAGFPSGFYNNINQPSQPNLSYTEQFVSIDSRHRDRTKYPDPSHYVIHFSPAAGQTDGAAIPNRYKNIKSIELVAGRVANQNSVLDQQYLNLEIEEISGPYDATGTGTQKAFAKMYFDKVVGNFVCISLDGVPYNRRIYQSGEINGGWSKWSVRITKDDGTLFNFGNDAAPPAAPTANLQNSFTFKLILESPNTEILGRRNI